MYLHTCTRMYITYVCSIIDKFYIWFDLFIWFVASYKFSLLFAFRQVIPRTKKLHRYCRIYKSRQWWIMMMNYLEKYGSFLYNRILYAVVRRCIVSFEWYFSSMNKYDRYTRLDKRTPYHLFRENSYSQVIFFINLLNQYVKITTLKHFQ